MTKMQPDTSVKTGAQTIPTVMLALAVFIVVAPNQRTPDTNANNHASITLNQMRC
jgi:hypothetical protein